MPGRLFMVLVCDISSNVGTFPLITKSLAHFKSQFSRNTVRTLDDRYKWILQSSGRILVLESVFVCSNQHLTTVVLRTALNKYFHSKA